MRKGDTYSLSPTIEALAATQFCAADAATWHQRLEHPHDRLLSILQNEGLILV